ncbi:MAG: hypothetical protein QG635_953, partial [Bacteroidota bacterium]|nr:hypothetical protein [Bacteroidota bacterium]
MINNFYIIKLQAPYICCRSKSLCNDFAAFLHRKLYSKKLEYLLVIKSLLIVFFIIFFISGANAQEEPRLSDSVIWRFRSKNTPPDSSYMKLDSSTIRRYLDSLAISDSVKAKKKSKSGLDTTVVYSAKDTVVFFVKDKKMRLRGDSKLHYQDQDLQAEIIELYFNNSTLSASGSRDSAGHVTGFPKFREKGEEYVGEKLLFNFKTNKGTISLGETKMSEGFYYGEKIKRISESEMFVQDGCYTTCDAPHPHFYFSSPEMKVAMQDRIYLDPLIFYVEDMPIFWLPIGLFFPSKSGRQSGIMIPTFFFSGDRGVVIQNIGAYFALSDYYDTQFMLDYFSKGGFTIKNKTQWALKDVFTGTAELQYGMTRFDPDADYNTNWSLLLQHNHEISPFERFNANVNISSQKFNQNTSTNLYQRIQQNISSRAAYSKTWENGVTTSLSFDRTQNLIDDTYSQTLPNLSVSMPNYMPLKSLISSSSPFSWINNVSVGYSMNALRSNSKIKSTEYVNDTTKRDVFNENHRASISHSPSISVSPRLGYFTLTPSFSFRANNYFRKVNKSYNSVDSSISENVEEGFYTEYWFSTGVSLSTRLYGILKPQIFGINAVRHTFQPTFSWSYSPSFEGDNYGFYGKYRNTATNQDVYYSYYEKDGGGGAPRSLSSSLNYNFTNKFETKIAQKDTLPDKNVELLTWTINGSANMAADSLKFSDVSMNFRIPTIQNINLNASAFFTPYEMVPAYDPAAQKYTDAAIKINKLLIESGKGLLRLTSLSFQLSTNISSNDLYGGGAAPDANTPDLSQTNFQENQSGFATNNQDTSKKQAGLGERFQNRMDYKYVEPDYFGDKTPGFSRFLLPWTFGINLNYTYSKYSINNSTETINLSANLSMSLTSTWQLTASAQFDFESHELRAPSISLMKDFH